MIKVRKRGSTDPKNLIGGLIIMIIVVFVVALFIRQWFPKFFNSADSSSKRVDACAEGTKCNCAILNQGCYQEPPGVGWQEVSPRSSEGWDDCSYTCYKDNRGLV